MNRYLHQAQSHEILRSWQSQRNDINHPKDFVLPMFIGNNDDAITPIESMPDVFRFGCNRAIEYLEPLVNNYGLSSVLLFPVITAGDKSRNETSDEDEEDDEDELAELSSSESQSQTSSSGDFSLSDTARRSSTVMPERLVNIEQTQGAMDNNNESGKNNPFLNQREETENLLDCEPRHHQDDHQQVTEAERGLQQTLTSRSRTPINPFRMPSKSKANSVEVTKARDIGLIRNLALRDKYNPVLRLIPNLRVKYPKLLIICDVCLCAFTSTGHCCLFEDHARAQDDLNKSVERFPISNKQSCQFLSMLAVEYAKRGCDVVAPSDMMDGRIHAIREKLSESGLHHVSVLSYSAKFASAFYGPFRQATDNAPEFGDRRAYQLPPGSRALALRAVQRDIDQGADLVMIKPGLAYLDIVRDISDRHPEISAAVYQVSGEYAMLKLAAKNGLVNLDCAMNETLTAFRRAGATIIITYFTPDILKSLSKQ